MTTPFRKILGSVYFDETSQEIVKMEQQQAGQGGIRERLRRRG